jgi:hypothetical protein
MRLKVQIRGDEQWMDAEGIDNPSSDLQFIIDKMKKCGFKIKKTKNGVLIINPYSNKIEAEYRIV